jgi:DNA modification methylase
MNYCPIGNLLVHPKNPNKHSREQIERLAELIKYQGWRLPIIVSNQSGYIVSGHGRLEAAKHLGLKEVPISYQDFTSEQEYAFLVSDNAIASWAELDLVSINFEVPNLGPDFEIKMLGMKDFAIEPAEKLILGCDEDEVPEIREAITKPGDLYSLGKHRLLCGDSTSIDDVEKLMNGDKADMVFTDPPYNLQEHGQTKRTNKTESKTELFGKWDEGFNPLDVLPMITAFTKENAHQFVCTSNWLFGVIHKYFEDLKEKPNYLVWIKNNPMPSLSKSTYVQSTELIVHSRKGSPKFNYPPGGNLRNVLEGNVEPHSSGHPSQKPIYVIEYALNYTEGSVLDLFGGSGSTLIACEKTNRKCFMMELDPKYCSVIVERWEKYTGKKAELLNGTS